MTTANTSIARDTAFPLCFVWHCSIRINAASSSRWPGSTASLVQRPPRVPAYVWLGWLRAAGFVKQHGRQGYSLVKPATFEKEVVRVFAEVPVQDP